jgi:hypothetical protein
MAAAAIPKRAIDTVERWKGDPVSFVSDVWGIDLEPFQEDAMLGLATDDRVSIRSGHGVGKSALASWAALWFLSTHYPAKVPITAPTAHQLEDVLHPEIGMWLSRMPVDLKQQFVLKADKLALRDAPQDSFAAFRTGNKANPEALQGFHSENILFVLDEASGIDDVVFEVAEGALSTPGARVLMTGNPTRAQGYFYDSHHSMRADWHTLRVSCEDSGRVAPEYVERMKRYGVESNVFRVRVLGEFPTSDADSIIPLEWAEAAVGREVAPISGKRAWGLDVARFGDARTALAKRWNNVLEEPIKSWRQKDTMQVCGLLMNEYEEAAVKPDDIFIDVIGIGAGVVDRCKEMGLPVRGINVAERPSVSDRYMRYRDELWFKGREWFESRECVIPDDGELIGELTTVAYEITSTGKIQVVSKEKMRRDGKPSPDLADAFLLTFAASRYAQRKWAPIQYDNRGIV